MTATKESTMPTLIGKINDATPATLEYGDYRGYVEVSAVTGEWVRDITDEERVALTNRLGDAVYSVEYTDLRPLGTGTAR